MNFIDLGVQQKKIRKQIESNLLAVLDHCQFVMGPEIKELEHKLSEFVGIKHAIGCGSGTDALLMALMAHGVGPGDAVITSPFTFIATAEAISLLGATPVFADIDANTFNIDPDEIERTQHALVMKKPDRYPIPNLQSLNPENLKGVITVDLFGVPAEHDRISKIADRNDLFVIEDAAQSFGAECSSGKACSFGNISCTSFFPAKPLGGYGDGGMCFTDDDSLAEILRSIRVHGEGANKYANIRIGLNGRLDTMQAAILLAKFDIFAEELVLRQQVADRYNALLDKISNIVIPEIPHGVKSAWAQYCLLLPNTELRERLQQVLSGEGIPTAIYYPTPLHLQKAFQNLGYKEGDFPVSENISRRIISLPMHPYLKETDQEKIASIIAATM